MDNKSTVFRIKTTKQFPGRYAEQTVFSVLVKAIRKQMGLTKKTIAQRTALDRGKTVSNACTWLVKNKLAELKNGRLWAVEPPIPEWFHWKNKEKPSWWDRFQYIKECVPNRDCEDRLSPRANSVFWVYVAWECKGIFPKISTVASQLRMSRDCVADCIVQLRKRGLMDDIHQVILANKKDFWQDKITKKKKAKPVGIRKSDDRFAANLLGEYDSFREYSPQFFETHDQIIDRLAIVIKRLRKADYSDDDVEEVLRPVFIAAKRWVVTEIYIIRFAIKALEYVEQVTEANRQAGIFSGRNSRGAMKHLSERVARTLRTRWETGMECWEELDPDWQTLWRGSAWKNG